MYSSTAVTGTMATEGVAVELIHMLDRRIGFGMIKDSPTSVTPSTTGPQSIDES